MAHWEFLNNKLGTDVVRYIIQPMLLPSKESVVEAKRAFLDIVGRMRRSRGKQEMILPVLNAFRVVWYPRGRKYAAHHAASQCRDCLSPVCNYCGDNVCRVDECKNLIYCKLCTLKRKQERGRIRRVNYQAKYRVKYAQKK